MSLGEIEIHFEKLMETDRRLADTAAQLQQLAEEWGVTNLALLRQAWISESADRMAGKEGRIIENLCESAIRLKKLSEEISETAQRYYEKEQENVRTAQFRQY